MGAKRFEDLDVWQRARVLTKSIYLVSGKDLFVKDWELRNQIRSAAISVMSNIAEGFDSGFNTEFARFLNMAKRSLSEIQSQLYIAIDQAYIDQSNFQILYQEAERIRKMSASLIKYLKTSPLDA